MSTVDMIAFIIRSTHNFSIATNFIIIHTYLFFR